MTKRKALHYPIERFPHYEVTSAGEVWSIKRRIYLKPKYGRDGYIIFGLMGRFKRFYFTGHRLVANACIDNPDNKPCVNHIDGNKKNNSAKNLEWVSYSENIVHAYATGLMTQVGENNNQSKLTYGEVYIIKTLLRRGKLTCSEIASFFNVGQGAISKIKCGYRWSHVELYKGEQNWT